ncbi:LuxR C-terminal-related transcriptional regulator [Patulibacter minatonensis]|uniref:LuxR C-terminal-related transcriptional regulator n=1 Tax=Patulibacter minatonensis TaxID=298163 RepID=UPI0012F82027|nr:response regulator transcription factor [Patulibacter minatonensis]
MHGLVIDDQGVARRGMLSLACEAFADAASWIGAESGAAGLELARRQQPDVVLMDMHPPDVPSGPALLGQLRTVVPAAQIVVMSGGTPGDAVKQCLESGADGALWKGSPEQEITLLLRQVAAGDRIIDTRVAAALAAREEGRRRAAVALTDRERAVLGLLAEGCSNREIGRRLLLSPATIKDHVRHLLQKLDASSRLQALVKAFNAGLLDDGSRWVP